MLWALLLATSCARAESDVLEQMNRAGYARLEALAREMHITWMAEAAERALSGEMLVDAHAVRDALGRAARSVRDNLMKALKLIAAPALVTALIGMLPGRRNEALALLCRLACAAALAAPCAAAMGAARDMLLRSARVADALAPVLAASMALTGEAAASAMMTPASALLTDIAQGLLFGLGLPLCAVAATVNIAGGLSQRYPMDRLFALIKRTAVWGTGVLVGLVTALLMAEGRVAAAQDAASVRAVRFTLRSLIPFVGSGIADSAGALIQSATVAKCAIGTAGMALALSACAGPLLRLAVYMLSLKLAAAAVEPVADAGIVRITCGYGDVAGMLFAVCAAGAMLNVLLCGLCLGVV